MEDFQLKDFSTAQFFEDPYALYERIRARGKLVPLGTNIVVTANFGLCEAMLQDRRLGRASEAGSRLRYGEDAMENPALLTLSKMFLTLNPPQHTRIRALVTQAFKASQVEAMREMMQHTVDRLIDALPVHGEFDLMQDFSLPLPVNIICQLLGVPVEDGLRLGTAASTLANVFDMAPLDGEGLAHVNQAALALNEYFISVVDQRRRQPGGNDLIAALVAAEEDGERLNDDEIVANVLLLFVAGHETTSNMICNAMLALHRHRDQLDALLADLSRVPQALAECMRYDSSVQMVGRTALEDLTIQDFDIRKGTMVFMLLGGANRDPERFMHADRLDIGRPDSGKLIAFGGGIHYCLGARLAQTEMEIALRTLLERMPGLMLQDVDHPRWRKRGNLRGVEVLTVARG